MDIKCYIQHGHNIIAIARQILLNLSRFLFQNVTRLRTTVLVYVAKLLRAYRSPAHPLHLNVKNRKLKKVEKRIEKGRERRT